MTYRVLYLDADYHLSLAKKGLADLDFEIIPEVINGEYANFAEVNLKIRTDEVLDLRGTRMSVYHPTHALFNAIQNITKHGNIDIVVIGNNNGAGLYKAAYVNPTLRERTVIIWNLYTPGLDDAEYKALGYTRFLSRHKLHEVIRELMLA
jgi:hypothetical protein